MTPVQCNCPKSYKFNETLEHLISWLKNYRGGSGLAARELACDEVAEPEDNVYFYFIVDTFLEAVSVRWLFTVFLFAKNLRTAVTKPSIKHCTRYGWPGPGASLSPMSGAEKTPLSRAMYLQNRYLEPSCSFINLIEQTDF